MDGRKNKKTASKDSSAGSKMVHCMSSGIWKSSQRNRQTKAGRGELHRVRAEHTAGAAAHVWLQKAACMQLRNIPFSEGKSVFAPFQKRGCQDSDYGLNNSNH